MSCFLRALNSVKESLKDQLYDFEHPVAMLEVRPEQSSR
jgi:hypothetical protein